MACTCSLMVGPTPGCPGSTEAHLLYRVTTGFSDAMHDGELLAAEDHHAGADDTLTGANLRPRQALCAFADADAVARRVPSGAPQVEDGRGSASGADEAKRLTAAHMGCAGRASPRLQYKAAAALHVCPAGSGGLTVAA
eukprot:CAMPEP_0181360964 /NCGR_PEP_ID=MMETSP1106-20121128/6999_1 /TAXON_ID=81844 /ORGANISM="Mantoniella antarctica, Strain SL-175" /LENGTH=138 /DNA_ID=CAMNT_0023474377 /DNA_START=907 /DNA_END=1320 /DNA_ORIENTATION=+